MKVITTNLLNRFWKKGVKPIKDTLDRHMKDTVGHITTEERNCWNKKLDGNADTVDGIHIKVVSALPSDAASHPDTLYIITG